MSGHGFAPKPRADRRNKNEVPIRGEWATPDEPGWRFGDVPEVPEGLMPASELAWVTWFAAWFAAFWTPDDLPGLRQLVRIYDQVERGEFQRGSELRLQMDTYGITPKGQQDRRWMRPTEDRPAGSGQVLAGRWADLKVVDAT